MALKRINPELSDTSLVTKIKREYKDLDLKFTAKPGTKFPDGSTRGDVYKKSDVKAIDQSINNILMTNYYERPFQPFFGADLTQLLFELNTSVSLSETQRIIRGAIEKDEPRVQVLTIEVFDPGADKMVPKGSADIFLYSGSADIDRYSLIIYVHCRIKNTGQDITVPVNMNRLR
jgi:phage baseplate assembly protein W